MEEQSRIQITTLHHDGTASMKSWPIHAEDAELYTVMLTDDQERQPDVSLYTEEGVQAIDKAAVGGVIAL